MNPSLEYVLEYRTANKTRKTKLLSKKIIKYKTLIGVVTAFVISVILSVCITLLFML